MRVSRNLILITVVLLICAVCVGCGESIDGLIKELEDPDVTIRVSAVKALGRTGDPRAVEPLVKALEDEEWEVRESAVEALERTGDPRVVEPLVKALEDEEENVRWAAANSLGDMGDPRAVEPLIVTLKEDEEGIVRGYAAEALGDIGDPRAVEPLAKALKDSSAQGKAAIALGKIGDERAIAALITALQERDMSQLVAKTLRQLDWEPKSIEERVHFLVARRDKDQLVSIWDQTKRVLLKDAESGEYSHIQNALYAFIGIGKEEILPVLIDKLDSEGNKTMAEAFLNCGHPELRNAAVEWADRHGYRIVSAGGTSTVRWGSW